MPYAVTRRTLLAAAATVAVPWAGRAARAADKPLRIGVLNDMTGVFADFQGPGSMVAARLAAEDGAAIPGRPIEVVAADHQNKPDVGMAIARRWLDQEAIDVILDVPNSAIALAVAALVRERNKVFIGSGAGIADLTGKACSPNTVHWTYDTWEVAHSLGQAITARGGKTWFLLNADYSFGADLAKNVTEAVLAAGGQVVGSMNHPFPSSDFSSFLVAAQASGAQVLGLNNAGGDMTNAIKQAAEFGLTRQMTIAGPVFNVNTVPGIGLAAAQGVLGVTPFYWDYDEGTRAFSARYAAALRSHAMPNDMQAGCYAALLHLFKAVAKTGGAEDGAAVVAAMKVIPTDDPLFGRGSIRADGRKIHPVYLVQTKSPAESTKPWDYFKVLSTIPADQAFRPMGRRAVRAGPCMTAITSAAVIGTGVIGASWAALFLGRGLDVAAFDPAPGAEAMLHGHVAALWPTIVALGLAEGADPGRLRFCATAESAVAAAGFVQENGPERLEMKQALFAALTEAASPDAILATSSSTLMITDVQARCRRPGRVVLGHPFNPPHLIPLVEVGGGRLTDPDAVDDAMAFYTAMGKRPIRLQREIKGHIANRLQAALWQEAFHLVQEGVATVADIDVAIAHGPGLRWALLGPFLNLHLSGGAGGLAHNLAHLGPAVEAMWRDLGTVHLDPALNARMCEGVDQALAGQDLPAMVAARDGVLLDLLQRKRDAGLP